MKVLLIVIKNRPMDVNGYIELGSIINKTPSMGKTDCPLIDQTQTKESHHPADKAFK